MARKILIIGAGLSGAVIARSLAQAGNCVTVVDERRHVAGNCHTARDAVSGVMVHVYGPHIFHTDDEEVWRYVNTHAQFRPYTHRVRIIAGERVYSLPINLHTINQFFGRTFGPDEARAFIGTLAVNPRNKSPTFEDRALQLVGRDLYETFLHGYTLKQWGRPPAELPASVLARLPVRFTYDDNYFFHRFQGMPEDGYTAMVEAILRHERIEVLLGTPFRRGDDGGTFNHVFYSGPIDRYYDYALGRLEYRTLDFETFHHDGDYQGCAVMNYGDAGVPYTRITEHRHFAPWESHAASICYREFSRACGPDDTPYYPVRLAQDTAQLRRYVERARQETAVTFVGRLGTYRYLDMDVTIREALDTARLYLDVTARGRPMPAFCTLP